LSEQKNEAGPAARFAAIVGRIAIAADTGDLVKWDKLAERLRDLPPPLTEVERCGTMLRIANGEALAAREWNRLIGVRAIRTRHATGAEPDDSRRIPAPPDLLEWLRTWLGAIVAHKGKAPAELVDAVAREASARVLIIPKWNPGHDREDRIIAQSGVSALAYGVWLLADPTRDFSADLCRCNYSACGKFFMKDTSTGGPPRRRFCTPEHEIDGDRERAKQRMATKRRKHK
jgi:hypothetical protein